MRRSIISDMLVPDSADAALLQIGHRVDVLCCYNELKAHPGKDGSIAVMMSVVEVAVSLEPVRRIPAELASGCPCM